MRVFFCNYEDKMASYFTKVKLGDKRGKKRAKDRKTSKTIKQYIFKIYCKDKIQVNVPNQDSENSAFPCASLMC